MATPVLIDLSNYDTLLSESQAGRGTTTGAATIDVVAAAGTLTRSAGDFLADRFKPGQTISISGYANGGNNVSKVIDTVTALVITVTDNTGLVDEAGDGDETITADVVDGNIFFDTHNGLIELITAEEEAQVDLGSGDEDNPLTNQLGIFIGAVYAFERQQRRTNEFLRQYDTVLAGTFKFAGAYELINGRKFSTNGSLVGDDREKLRGSGWIERLANGDVDRIYFGVRSLGNIESTSQPYYQLSDGGAPVNFEKVGPIDEAIDVTGQVSFLSNKVRTYGFNYDEKRLIDSGITEMAGYSAGFALGETPHLTTDPNTMPLADVYGGSQVAPWTGMSLEKLAAPQTEGGFTQADGDFTWVLHNTGGGTLDECVAFLDALAQTDDDIDSGAETTTQGKRVGTWYTYDAQGRIVTRSGADALGLFIENVPVADQQRIVFTADDASEKTYPFLVQLNINVGSNAAADANAWYHVYEAADYGTPAAVTVNDSDGLPIKGNVGGLTTISAAVDYDGDLGGADLDIVVECEGDGTATQARAEATITRDATVNVACSPGLETNV